MEGVGAKQTGKARRKEKRLQSEPGSIEGGANGGPRGVNVLDFAEARAMELCSMLKAVRSKSGSKRVFQLLPRHMRRRAMSHNVKRLPRRLRAVASKEFQMQGSETTAKPPSRRQRRKHKSLRDEYSRRQRSHVWLETHLWHAKRMHMVNKWGYRLANYLNEKGVRSTYRSLMYGCLLLDMSYYPCVQVCGPSKDIISSLSSLFSTQTGLSIGAKAFTKGQREGIAVMYHDGTYPTRPIGPVQFLWCAAPSQGEEKGEESEMECLSVTSKLWLFCHPSMFEEALREVQKATSKCDIGEVGVVNDVTSGVGGVTPISVHGLKDELVRFRLLGPRSHAVVMEVLKPILDFSEQGAGGPCSTSDNPQPWWADQRSTLQGHARLLSSLYPTILAAATPSVFSRGTVVGMVVSDPRLIAPSTRANMVSSFYPKKLSSVKGPASHVEECSGDSESDYDEELSKAVVNMVTMSEATMDGKAPVSLSTTPTCAVPILPPRVAYSPLWDEGTRNAVSLSKVPDHILNEARSKQFPRQGDLQIGGKGDRVPVLLVHQSTLSGCFPASLDKSNCVTGCGWDLLLPKDWGMAFWVALVYCGAHACGLRELQRCLLECRALQFPNDFPDTAAGRREGRAEQDDQERKYRCFPPAKRPNYGKLSIAAPFHCSWENLFTGDSELLAKRPKNDLYSYHGEVTPGQSDSSVTICFYVLRSRAVLTNLVQLMEHTSLKNRQCSQRKAGEVTCTHGGSALALKETHCNALVAISFETFGRGKVSSWAALYVPTKGDLKSLVDSKTYTGPVEPINRRGITIVSKESIHIGTSIVSKKQQREMLRGLKSKISTVTQSGSTSTVTQSGSTSTVTQSGSTSTVTQSGSTSTVTQSGSTSTVTQSGSTSTVTQPGSVSSSHSDGVGCSLIGDLKLQPITASRQVIGYATRTGYRLSTSKFGGLGYVSLSGLLQVIELSCEAGIGHVVALVRSHGTQYRFVRLQLII